jgi:predicted ATPase
LALELCAAQVDLLSPAQLLAHLHARRLDLLEEGAADLPPRQRTLRTAIQHSYALLDEAERTLLRTLGVFVGGFDLATVEAVADVKLETSDKRLNEGASPQSLASTLHSLVGKSLVHAETTPAGEQRLLLLETIREFVLAQMSSEERMATQQRHTTYFATQAVPNLDVLVRDYANFHAALVAAIAAHDTHAALTLCLKLDEFWTTYGYWREGITLMRAALAIPDEGDVRLRLDVLETASTLAPAGRTGKRPQSAGPDLYRARRLWSRRNGVAGKYTVCPSGSVPVQSRLSVRSVG